MTRPLPQLTPDTAVGRPQPPTIAHTHPPGLREAPAPRLCSRLARKRAIGKLSAAAVLKRRAEPARERDCARRPRC